MIDLGKNRRQRAHSVVQATFVMLLTLVVSSACTSTPPAASPSDSPPASAPAVSDEMPPYRESPIDSERLDTTRGPIAELSDNGRTLTISRIDSGCITEPTAFSFDGESTYTVTFDFVVPNPEGICDLVAHPTATEFALASAPAARPVTVEFTLPDDSTVTLTAH